MSEWQVLLLGGTAAVGKSTGARELARRLRIACISGDSIWKAVTAVTTPETHPTLHQWPWPEEPTGSVDDLTRLHIAEAETLTPALEAFIDSEVEEGNRFVIDAAWITAELAARKCASSPQIRAVFIDEPLAEEVLASMLERSGRTQPSHRQVVMSQVASRYGAWLRQEALRRSLPVVPARPRETLVDRILEASNRISPPD